VSASRHAILVRLLSAEQREAIEAHAHRTRTSPSESLSAALRRILLSAAGRSDLDRPAQDTRFRDSRERARIAREVGGDLDKPID
jgi:hypothetical protein